MARESETSTVIVSGSPLYLPSWSSDPLSPTECQSALTGVGLFKPLNGPRRKPKRKRKPRGFRGRHHAFEPVEPPTCLVGLEKDGVTISQFLNRILGLTVELQNRLFSYFSDTLVAIVDRAKREGYWDGGIMDFGCSEENVQIVNTEDFAAANIANTQLYTVKGLMWSCTSASCIS